MRPQTIPSLLPDFTDAELEALLDNALPLHVPTQEHNNPPDEFFFAMETPAQPPQSPKSAFARESLVTRSLQHTALPFSAHNQSDYFEITLDVQPAGGSRLIPAEMHPWHPSQPLGASLPMLPKAPRLTPANLADNPHNPAISATKLTSLPVSARTEVPTAWSNELRSLSSTILVAAKSQKQRTFLVCDLTPGAGAEVITRGLSQSLTGVCKANVLYCGLSGTDMTASPQTSAALQRNEPYYLRQTGLPNLQELTTSNGKIAMSDLLSRYDLQVFISQLKREFDLVLFDAPPITLHAEVELLAAHVDGVILVVQPGVTAKAEIQKVQARLQKAEANILGVVFHQTGKKRRRFF